MFVFNRHLVKKNRDKASTNFARYDFLFREVGIRLIERLKDLQCHFSLILELGYRSEIMRRFFTEAYGKDKYLVVHSELSERMIHYQAETCLSHLTPFLAVVADEERLPFKEGSFDLIISNLTLHWINDLPNLFLEVLHLLKAGGLFLASLIGGYSLSELHIALEHAETTVLGRPSLRVSPFIGVHDIGNLLQRVGFNTVVVDLDTIIVKYSNPLQLLLDLRGMGETNATLNRKPLCLGTLKLTLDHYFSTCTDADGRVPATFQILYLTAWHTSSKSNSNTCFLS